VLTALSYGDNRLTFTVNASSGNTSITKVYCTASKGMPNRVDGASTWSYAGGIATVNVLHASTQQAVLTWVPGGLPSVVAKYVLTVTVVDESGAGLPNVNVTITIESITLVTRQTNINGQYAFWLESGTYVVTAGTVEDTVLLEENTWLTLTLPTREITPIESKWLFIPPQVRQVLVYVAIAIVGLLVVVLAVGFVGKGKGKKKGSVRKRWERTW